MRRDPHGALVWLGRNVGAGVSALGGVIAALALWFAQDWLCFGSAADAWQPMTRADTARVRLTDGACEKLTLHPWYGNIRELEHAIEKAIIICDNETLPAELFQLARRSVTPEATASTLEDMEMQMIRKTLDKCSGNLSAVAAQLGITRQTMYNKMKKYGL